MRDHIFLGQVINADDVIVHLFLRANNQYS